MILSTAVVAQVTYGLLVARADDEDIPITAQLGRTVYIITWLSFAFSVATSLLWAVRMRSLSSKPKSSNSTIIGKLPRGYKMINVSQDEIPGDEEDDAQLIQKPRQVEPKRNNLNEDTKYEPFRRSAE